MADVTLTYNGQNILEMSASGTKTLKAAGKICKTDIEVAYVKSGGGSGSGNNILKGSSPPSAGIGQDGDVYLQYDTIDGEIENTYVKVNGTWVALVGSDVNDVADSGMYTGTEAHPPASLGTDGDYYYQRGIWLRSIQSVNASIQWSHTSAYGTEFTVTQPVTVTHLFARTAASTTGKLQIGTTALMLAETATVSFKAGEWVEVQLESPIQLSTGTNYVVKVLVNSSPGYVSYVNSISELTYDSKFSYVRSRYGTSWPGTSEERIGVLVGVTYLASEGVYTIRKQFHKASGSWSEIT